MASKSKPDGNCSRATRNKYKKQSSVDESVLKPSINVTFTGMRQGIKALEHGSSEVRDYLLNECNVIYECRVCLNMFRSLANLVSHKRSFCCELYKEVNHVYRRDPREYSSEHLLDTRSTLESSLATAFVQPEPVETILNEEWDLKDYSPTLNLLQESGLLEDIGAKPPYKRLLPQKKTIDTIANNLKEKQLSQKNSCHYVNLEKINQTSKAVFQTYGELSKEKKTAGQKYNELQKTKRLPTVFVGPDGKSIEPRELPNLRAFQKTDENLTDQTPNHYNCVICNAKILLFKSLGRHYKEVHRKSLEESHELRERSKNNALKLLEAKNSSGLGNIKFSEKPILAYKCKGCFKGFKDKYERNNHQLNCVEPLLKIEKLSSETISQFIPSTTKQDKNSNEKENLSDNSSESSFDDMETSSKSNDEDDSGIDYANTSEISSTISDDVIFVESIVINGEDTDKTFQQTNDSIKKKTDSGIIKNKNAIAIKKKTSSCVEKYLKKNKRSLRSNKPLRILRRYE